MTESKLRYTLFVFLFEDKLYGYTPESNQLLEMKGGAEWIDGYLVTNRKLIDRLEEHYKTLPKP
jgi:hypothetical protein